MDSVGQSLWLGQRGAGAVAGAVWGRRCGWGSVGQELWLGQCGAGAVAGAAWGTAGGVAIGTHCDYRVFENCLHNGVCHEFPFTFADIALKTMYRLRTWVRCSIAYVTFTQILQLTFV